MTYKDEDRSIVNRNRVQQELQRLLAMLEVGQTRLRINEYARRGVRSVGIYQGYHPGKDFPFEVSIDGRRDFFALGQFTVIFSDTPERKQ